MRKCDFKPPLLKLHFGIGFLLQICCIFSEHLFLRTPLEGCFWTNGGFHLKWIFGLDCCKMLVFCISTEVITLMCSIKNPESATEGWSIFFLKKCTGFRR